MDTLLLFNWFVFLYIVIVFCCGVPNTKHRWLKVFFDLVGLGLIAFNIFWKLSV
ncbi:hypothetical protein IGI96_001749 [Enterococcus sp. DIV0421]|uniref:hypothetical protein n=1 Tax=Enterococcus sp. DIV0421 TaxID=2774688 RepID=UPI003F204084